MSADIATRPVVYRMPCMDDVIVRRTETLDLYCPPAGGTGLPIVLFVMGFPDAGTRRMIGCSAKDMASYVGWARLVATFGMVGVTYIAEEPAAAMHDVLRQLRDQAGVLGIDSTRIGVWACSGHVPMALSLLMSGEPGLGCAALLYGYTLDLDQATHVADAAARFRFVNAAVGRSVEELPRDLPLLIVRAGSDEMPGLNQALDAFIAQALRANLPLSLINHPRGPHAFDIVEDSDASARVVMRTLAFLQMHLRPAMMAVGQEKPGLDIR